MANEEKIWWQLQYIGPGLCVEGPYVAHASRARSSEHYLFVMGTLRAKANGGGSAHTLVRWYGAKATAANKKLLEMLCEARYGRE